VRRTWPACRILAVDRASVLEQGISRRVIDAGSADQAGLAEADLVVLAAPVRQNIVVLRRLAGVVPASTIVTDVGGTKRAIVEAARESGLAATFVGGHPLGGAARGGLGSASPDLFTRRPWIFTPTEEVPGDIVERLCRFATALGASPVSMSSSDHDRVMAFLSHLPQLAASTLMDVIGASVGSQGMTLAGQGLLDTTRLASSPPEVWKDICATNAAAIGDALDLLSARLAALRADLADGAAIDEIFGAAARWRAELMKSRE
jgi:prephenate dehydrogenase